MRLIRKLENDLPAGKDGKSSFVCVLKLDLSALLYRTSVTYTLLAVMTDERLLSEMP